MDATAKLQHIVQRVAGEVDKGTSQLGSSTNMFMARNQTLQCARAAGVRLAMALQVYGATQRKRARGL